jgi:predicted O-methyltransferase YrrM
VADELATRVLRNAVEAGLIPKGPFPDWERYREYRALVREEFVVPETSITPLMARVLYGISLLAKPLRILGIGTYCGNALVWLTGPGFGPDRLYSGVRAVGVDTDASATATATGNFSRIGSPVELRVLDGHRAAETLDDTFDLVLLDADDPHRRKEVYLSLLDSLHPCLTPGALVLAHDICVPIFAEQLGEYQRTVRADPRFAGSLSLAIDACGLELSLLGGSR